MGNEPLFEGLHIHEHWDGSVRHPVGRLSFGSGNFTEPGSLEPDLTDQPNTIERRAGVVSESATGPRRLASPLHGRSGQPAAVLIDTGKAIRHWKSELLGR